MSFLWDSNILRHYLDDHPLLLENLKKVPRHDVVLPVVVVAEQFTGTPPTFMTYYLRNNFKTGSTKQSVEPR